jgi:hypothetical protein
LLPLISGSIPTQPRKCQTVLPLPNNTTNREIIEQASENLSPRLSNSGSFYETLVTVSAEGYATVHKNSSTSGDAQQDSALVRGLRQFVLLLILVESFLDA